MLPCWPESEIINSAGCEPGGLDLNIIGRRTVRFTIVCILLAVAMVIVTSHRVMTLRRGEWGCREVRAFLGVEAFGRNLDGQLVQDEQGYLAALQQLRSAKACTSPLGCDH